MIRARACPECSADIEVVEGFPDWCERCEWNVLPPELPQWGYGDRSTG
jgi:hypothetical protein